MNLRGKLAQLSRVFRPGNFNAKMDDEMRHHLELREERLIAGGMSPEEARYAASRAFGGIEQLKGRARDQRSLGWIEDAWQDVNYGLRMMRRNPVFSAAAVLSLGLGIGAATAVFNLMNAILLGSLPVPNPQELRVINWSAKDTHNMGIYAASAGPNVPNRKSANTFSVEVFKFFRSDCAGLAELFGFQYFNQVAGTINAETFNISTALVSGNYFSALQVQPALGELLGPEDEKIGAPARVVITDRIWTRYFNRDPKTLGKVFVLNQHPFAIAGVLPAQFTGVEPGQSSDLFASLSSQALLTPFPEMPDLWWLQIMARLKPGVSTEQLKTLLDVKLASAADKVLVSPESIISDGHDGPIWGREPIRDQLKLLFIMTGLVVLVACANLAGLLIARGVARRYELSLRQSLGAGQNRLVRQLMTETFLISILGGGIGLTISFWAKTTISHLLSGSADELPFSTPFSFRVFLFACAATILTTVLAGLLPALKGSRASLQDELKSRSRSWFKVPMGQALVALQITLSLLIATGAALCARTLVNLMRVNPGFQIEHLLTFGVQTGNTYKTEELLSFANNIQRALSAIPGVDSAAILAFPLLGGGRTVGDFAVTDRPAGAGDESYTDFLVVGNNFFRTIKIPILSGREFAESDTKDSPKVTVINQAFAHKYFPDRSAVGHSLTLSGKTAEIVGVCADIKAATIKSDVQPTFYLPFAQQPQGWTSFAIRTKGAPLSIALEVQRVVRTVDPRIPILNLSTEEQLRDQNIVSERMFAKFSGALTVLVLILSSIGLYGLVAYDVAGRTREIGIRAALGARRTMLVNATLKRAMLLTCAALCLGIPLTFVSSQLVRTQLYGVVPSDPLALVGACLLLLTVSLVAAWIPIRRATRIDPMAALRCD